MKRKFSEEEGKLNMLNNEDIVVYALYLLGGWQKRVHTEDVALKCYELAPTKFSWVKYPQYPDVAPARFALEASKILVKGESEKKKNSKNIGGWMLTANGVEWFKKNRRRIEENLGKHIPTGDRLPSDRKLKELSASTAFKKFRDCRNQAEISHAEFTESLICTVNTAREVLNDRLEQLYSIAKELKREDVESYIDFCRDKFASILN